jgi:hypothetical protein
MARADLAKLVGTQWVGTGELWLDPLGNEAHRYECAMSIGTESVRYTWSHEGKAHEGTINLREDPEVIWRRIVGSKDTLARCTA